MSENGLVTRREATWPIWNGYVLSDFFNTYSECFQKEPGDATEITVIMGKKYHFVFPHALSICKIPANLRWVAV